jgi:hypothetical protein
MIISTIEINQPHIYWFRGPWFEHIVVIKFYCNVQPCSYKLQHPHLFYVPLFPTYTRHTW